MRLKYLLFPFVWRVKFDRLLKITAENQVAFEQRAAQMHKNICDLSETVGQLRNKVETKTMVINRLRDELNQSRKNDSPQDPETGRFVKRSES